MNQITTQRKEVLLPFVNYIAAQINSNKSVDLVFICTHNSRRSQFAQVWAKYYASKFKILINSFSGGTEVTACNESTIASLKRTGFEINKKGESNNPLYTITIGSEKLVLYSKLYDDESLPKKDFAAIMTCSQAEQNCPFILGASKRISLSYDDPKEFDETELEASKYDERSAQIAQEMEYVFSKVNEIVQ